MINPEINMEEVVEGEYSCLSFNNYGYVAEVADKISDEFQAEEEDFDFCENTDTSIAGFIYDDQTKFQQPIFPVFNRDLLLNDVSDESHVKDSKSEDADGSIRISLRKLFLEDESETKPPGTYKPKSKSTGFVSKRWSKIGHLLRRSNSEGKKEDSFVFLTKNSSEVVNTAGILKQTKGEKGSPAVAASAFASHLALYRAGKEADKKRRKSYLPYRQDLISYRPF